MRRYLVTRAIHYRIVSVLGLCLWINDWCVCLDYSWLLCLGTFLIIKTIVARCIIYFMSMAQCHSGSPLHDSLPNSLFHPTHWPNSNASANITLQSMSPTRMLLVSYSMHHVTFQVKMWSYWTNMYTSNHYIFPSSHASCQNEMR